jgi:hypothetical protein
MAPAGLILGVLLAAVPPLTDDEAARLRAAVDGTDQRAEAFAALVENAARWTPASAGADGLPAPDLDALLADPAAYRGRPYRVSGVIQQQVPLAYPYEHVGEWFVRDRAGRPVIVYVCGLGPDQAFGVGRAVEITARFYKSIAATARDGRQRRYAAFVGALPRPGPAAREGWGRLWLVAAPVAVMLLVFLLLLLYGRRGGGPKRVRAAAVGPWIDPGDEGLPDDPADALAELRRRAEADE